MKRAERQSKNNAFEATNGMRQCVAKRVKR